MMAQKKPSIAWLILRKSFVYSYEFHMSCENHEANGYKQDL